MILNAAIVVSAMVLFAVVFIGVIALITGGRL